MPESRTLIVTIYSYWHPGTGRGRGSHVDALAHRNALGLPSLPGRTLKGVLRDAVTRAEQWHWYGGLDPGLCDRLFGARGRDGAPTGIGLLRFTDASLPPVVSKHLAQNAALCGGLYRDLFQTAVAQESGVAMDKSLRGIQVVVPLTLEATVSIRPHAAATRVDAIDWAEQLGRAFPLVRSVGAHRARGLGRCRLSWKEQGQ